MIAECSACHGRKLVRYNVQIFDVAAEHEGDAPICSPICLFRWANDHIMLRGKALMNNARTNIQTFLLKLSRSGRQ